MIKLESKACNINYKDSLCYVTFKNLEKCGNVRHAFSTRMGGVSIGQFSTMNLSFTVGDNPEAVRKNYRILCHAVGIHSSNVVLTAQTHTDNILTVNKSYCAMGIYKPLIYRDVDALITNVPEVALCGHGADCPVILFNDPVRNVIAVAHAGWRGTVKEIARKTVNKMRDVYGCKPQNIVAAISPSIGPCCYEVDETVYNEFLKLYYLPLDAVFTAKENGKYMLNLWQANKLILIEAGLKPENIDLPDLCTRCNSGAFHSHRATNGRRGGNGGIIELIPKNRFPN